MDGDEAMARSSFAAAASVGRSRPTPSSSSSPWRATVSPGGIGPIRYGVLRSDGTVRALAIETDEARSEAPRMAPDETIPFDHVGRGRPRGGDGGLPALQARKPDDPGVAEARLNRLGYSSRATGASRAALVVLQVNTSLYPDSANTWDSLAEVSLQAASERGRSSATARCSRCCRATAAPTR